MELQDVDLMDMGKGTHKMKSMLWNERKTNGLKA